MRGSPSLPAEVRVEPMLALDGGPDGLALVRRLVAEAPALLGPLGVLALEIGVGIDGESRTGVLENAELDSALSAEFEGLFDGESVTQVDVIVVDGEWGLGGVALEKS